MSKPEPTLQEKFRRVDEGKRIPLAKLHELAFCEDLQSQVNELESAAEQLSDPDVRGEERAEVREHMQAAAASVHRTLEALSHYIEHLVDA